MGPAGTKSWGKGELYDFLCLTGIAICLWEVGIQFDLFPMLSEFMTRHGLSSIVCLGFLMSFFVAVGSARKSLLLRREMVGRAEAVAQAQSLARHDPLTGMPNRRLLRDVIHAATRSNAERWAVFLIDLDRFKAINDIHGHEAGDVVLCQVADRIRSLMPDGATAARLGGDEFAVLLRYKYRAELMRLAEQVAKSLASPVLSTTTPVEIGATIGIALFPGDGTEPEALLRCADIAMYRSKREGRGSFRFFEQSMDEELRARSLLEASLVAAIAKGEIRPHYQPLVAYPAQDIAGFEVLARWYHPEKGVLSPDLFIAVAEETGHIAQLSQAILRQACLDAKAWPTHLRLAVNVSPLQLKDPHLAQRLLAVLASTGFDPRRLEVEITESALTSDIEIARVTLQTLQAAGVTIALDDFGTGYSSLCHLRDINFDKIKIDRSFVQSMGQNPESAKIVSAIIGLGRSMGVATTAEGIETLANSEWLSQQGCTCGQGFLFGRPMSAADINRGLRDGSLDAMAAGEGDETPVRRAIA